MTEKAKRPGRWKAGESGNPQGRKPGTSQVAKLRASLAGDVPEILAGLVEAAKGGDVQAARLILERILPPVRAIEQAVELQLPEGGTLTSKANAVLAAAASGQLAPGQASQLITAIGQLARLTEIDELAARITALEANHADQ